MLYTAKRHQSNWDVAPIIRRQLGDKWVTARGLVWCECRNGESAKLIARLLTEHFEGKENG